MAAPAFDLDRRTSCPVCGTAPSGVALVDLPFDEPPLDGYLRGFYDGRLDPSTLRGARYVLVRCPDCALVYQVFVPDDAALARLYSEIVSDDEGEVQSRRGLAVRRDFASQVEQLLRHFGRPPGDVSVLDYGGGWGMWTDMAAAYGCETAAAELSAHRRAVLAGRHLLVDPDDLPEASYDYVNAEQVLEHVVAPLDVLGRIAASLRPGGLVRIGVPNGSDIDERLAAGDWAAPKGSARSLNAVAPLEHVNCFDHGSLTRLALEAGGLEPFRYPIREYLDPWERARTIGSAVWHRVRPSKGTTLTFRRTTSLRLHPPTC